MYELVGAPDALSQAALTLTAAPRVAVDTESDSRHRYPERVCLVQIAGAGRVYLIDPLLVPDLAPLRALLESRRVEKSSTAPTTTCAASTAIGTSPPPTSSTPT